MGMRFFSHRVGAGLCLVACFMSGCVRYRVVRDGWATLRALGDSPSPASDKPIHARPPAPASDKWSILLASFDGPSGQHQARKLVERLHGETHLPDLWTRDTASRSQVYRGIYSGPSDPGAQDNLRQTRMVRLDGQLPFASAKLAPLGDRASQADTVMDLRQHTGMYSLQIAYYDDAFGPGFRQAAQQAAESLRQQGDDAYFYHGPHRSMVTIGLFTDDDFVQKGQQQSYGDEIKALQEKYRFNLGNGRTIIEKINGESIGEQPSFLVRVY